MTISDRVGPLPEGHPLKGTHIFFGMRPQNLTRKNSEMEVDTLEAKMRERLEARGTIVRSMTPEEAASIPIFLHLKPRSTKSKQNTPQRPEDETNNDPMVVGGPKETLRSVYGQRNSRNENSKK